MLRGRPGAVCVLAFRERADETSKSFATASAVLGHFEAAGCSILPHGDYLVNEADAPESAGLLTGMWEVSAPSGAAQK